MLELALDVCDRRVHTLACPSRVSITLQVSALTADNAAQAERIAELVAARTSLQQAVSELEGGKDEQEKALQNARLEIGSLERQCGTCEEALTSLTSEVRAQMPRGLEQMHSWCSTVA